MDTMEAASPRRPSGRHRISATQLRAEETSERRTGRLPATTPGRALAAFKRAEPTLGVAVQIAKLIDYLVGCTRQQDWTGEGVLGPIAWPSDVELEERLGVGPSQRKSIVRGALDAGYVRLRRSPNGKRWGLRDKAGLIRDAYGFDLSPLAERQSEFERLAAEYEARREEGRHLRREIGRMRGEVLALTALATEGALAGEDWNGLAAQADALMQARGRERDPLRLLPIAARMRVLHVHVKAAAFAAIAHALPATQTVESTPMEPEYRPHNTTTNQLPIVNTIARSAPALGQEKERKQSSDHPGHAVEASGPTVKGFGALRGFVATPDFVAAIAPAFRSWAGPRPGWQQLIAAAGQVRADLGISQHAWGQACVVLGRQEAVVALAAIAARHERGLVRSPGGLLRCLVDSYVEGTLRLDRTLFGLASKLGAPDLKASLTPT